MKNISFGALGKHGRLGNQLFQIASTMGLAEKYETTAIFPNWSYESYFENKLTHGPMQTLRVKEMFFYYYDWELQEDCDIFGYLQSEKYFGSTRLKFRDIILRDVKRRVPIFDKETICIQVRRGDYVGNPNYYQLPITFYLDALITHFPNWRKCNILVTSDDIEYCRVHFECLPNVTFSPLKSEIEDMALASCCDHFIISNSTWGWWAAWLGEKVNTKVVHSGYLATDLLPIDPKDYRPERWINHHKDNYRLPAQDVTFTIPVFMDHADRRNNLDLTLCMLQKDLNTHFIISEQGGNEFEYTKQWVRYYKFDSNEFHRTRMLNIMAEFATTPYIVNWDCDVIISPIQLFMAVDKLRAGADVVFPYDGRFARLPRAGWFPLIQKSLDIGIVKNQMFKGRELDHHSVGGAVMFSKEAFIDGGMENENMISFGPEDCERNDRFKLLGYDVRMTPGSLFHINHFVGPNSNPSNPHFKANHAELEKMRKMTREEMRAYVDTWPWRDQYTSRYYRKISEGSIRSANIIYAQIGGEIKSVIDIGCGVGEWQPPYECFYYGVDHHVKEKDLLIPANRYMDCNLNEIFPTFTRKFDLALCLEVAEHLQPHRAQELVRNLCEYADRVLFSAAIPFQGGTGHVNEQFQSWWAELFKQNGFGAALLQPDLSNPDIEIWYRNNMILYERNAVGKVFDSILPEFYMEITGHLSNLLSKRVI